MAEEEVRGLGGALCGSRLVLAAEDLCPTASLGTARGGQASR